jgi:hypothetical protein
MRKRSEREIKRQNHWQEILAGQRQSRQSVRAYCRQAGVEEAAFYRWRRKLTRHSAQPNDPLRPGGHRRAAVGVRRQGKAARPGRKPPGSPGSVGFLSVQVAATAAGAEAGQAIEIVLAGQRVLRVPPGFDRQTLLRALDALEGRGC